MRLICRVGELYRPPDGPSNGQARATALLVRLARGADAGLAEVSDNGCGFDPGLLGPRHGLRHQGRRALPVGAPPGITRKVIRTAIALPHPPVSRRSR